MRVEEFEGQETLLRERGEVRAYVLIQSKSWQVTV